MDDELARQIAASLDATPELLPLIPELCADCWALGSWPELIVELLRPLDLPARATQALELGCGKGAVVIPLARELGFQLLGIDGFQPFLDEATKRAEEARVSELCRLEWGDIREAVGRLVGFDVAVYAAHGPTLLGKPCVLHLRKVVRPGGFMVIDNGYLAETIDGVPAGYEEYGSRDEMLGRMTACGDELIGEVIPTDEEQIAADRRDTELIRKRAEELARRRPEVADSVMGYVRRQEEVCAEMEHTLAGGVWLLQRR